MMGYSLAVDAAQSAYMASKHAIESASQVPAAIKTHLENLTPEQRLAGDMPKVNFPPWVTWPTKNVVWPILKTIPLLNPDFRAWASDAVVDLTIGPFYQMARSAITAKPVKLIDVVPGATGLASRYPGVREGFEKVDQDTKGRLSDAFLIATSIPAAVVGLGGAALVASSAGAKAILAKVVPWGLAALGGWWGQQRLVKAIEEQIPGSVTIGSPSSPTITFPPLPEAKPVVVIQSRTSEGSKPVVDQPRDPVIHVTREPVPATLPVTPAPTLDVNSLASAITSGMVKALSGSSSASASAAGGGAAFATDRTKKKKRKRGNKGAERSKVKRDLNSAPGPATQDMDIRRR
jgi:hypothetical protein